MALQVLRTLVARPTTFAIATLLAGCDCEDTGASTSTDNGAELDSVESGSTCGDAAPQPFRQGWIEVLDQPFFTFNPDGTGNITSVSIGNAQSQNFRNRGDVTILFHDEDRIVVEMRKFTMASNATRAQSDFDRLSLWASTAPTIPAAPYALDPEDDCFDPSGETPWRTGCRIMVFYDGQTQLERSGADLRITLPRSYVYDIDIDTEDNAADSDYQNRGNVCIDGLRGSAEIELGNGTAYVVLDDSIRESPTCSAEFTATCKEVGWDPDTCPCISQNRSFGLVRVTSRGGTSADAFVDLPSREDFWVSYSLRNDGPRDPGNETPGAQCEAFVDASAGDVAPSPGIDLVQAPNENRGSINNPGPPATAGAGYAIQVTSDECQAVLSTEDPRDFVCRGNGPEQESAERGNLRICSGCLRSESCESWLPGS